MWVPRIVNVSFMNLQNKNHLNKYFNEDERKTWASGSGCLPFYNHTNGEPNMKKIGDLPNNKMTVVALKDIKEGEELVSQYYSAAWRKCFHDLK
jgi:hypothetical protein